MADTPDVRTLYEEQRVDDIESQLPNENTGHHVDVSSAERQFNELSRQYSIKKSTLATASVETAQVNDIEKGAEEEESFDLREYLTSSNDANQQAGIQHKRVGVTWEDLQVDVIGGDNSKFFIRTFASEMCLVLGCPGAGCTTFLKVIANQREEYANVSGQVLYAGMDAAEMAKYYKGEVVYNEEDDRHIATLTVEQTLKFALSTKTPGPNGRLPGVSRQEFDQEVLDTLLRMLNITHTRRTLVGDEFVRGVSGGERKRVSIAEMMTTRARVQSWDNSTRGLDASTALDFVKSLRVMTDILGQTTFVTLYQAGEGIYDLFDKVMVLSEGRQVFYGPPSEALPLTTSLDVPTSTNDSLLPVVRLLMFPQHPLLWKTHI
ncbi:P-loop containing nucleoside triphosphate hydrolase protein [Lentinula raphanica]|uniref:P-loop containing nucleoside triphosphate hydrolase protein n=1 Tax=Lentinula raphanica TaxID=153919 RepID=A0AA38NWF1_9AGAR|nr:P-loop containing nucleoside triphosphate hydrolase protein [Lentinula raphanica]